MLHSRFRKKMARHRSKKTTCTNWSL